ncbi:DUF4982 domain-containing protein [Muricomes sp. OA1]|uniref:Glycoside hydrolase family 2 protein n=2 Tax=Lachnospiraceae TaxID=186803 RepID=A0A3E2WYV2_9FIRM|nr:MULTISPECIES: glycoside hydrolase family 2 TIM barrel-domain containing protein [Clostridia]MCH1971399.1 DUF4982 domain-containing protein [Muricomes sp. OA1]RGC32661.1 glycoside hydrolase family 2 protein [Hungatella hathewayi]GKH34695.1 beta-galactosidase [Faecalicatena contorta]
MTSKRLRQKWLFWKDGCEYDKQEIYLPHDAMIYENRDAALENGNATGYFPGGKYFYSTSIYGDESFADKRVMLEFEGVYMNSKVLFNGEEIGGHIYGYTNFYVDLTGRIQTGKENELLVIADNSQTPNSRWYSGSGIYRPVNLWVGAKNGIKPEGVKITTMSVSPAVVSICVDAYELEDAEIVHEVILGDEKLCEAGGACAKIEIPDAKLWDAEHPSLYMLHTMLKRNGITVDETYTRFGVRMLSWNAVDGFMVNGRTVKLKGGCIHHDNGLLGARTYDKAERRRVQRLKDFGFNAIRYSHNPAGKNFLDICDELGMYVLDESFDQWKVPQSAHDYANHFDAEWRRDVEALVSKDYNHPCVIMYCIGNEITDTGFPHGAVISKMLSDAFHELDDTRPTTIAINSMLSMLANMQAKKKMEVEKAANEAKERKASGEEEIIAQKAEGDKAVGSQEVNDIVALLPKIMASITPESLEALIGECVKNVDIVGYNYGHNLYEGTHELVKERVILSSETFPQRMADNWKAVMHHPYVIGDFMWTAWDYLGETGVGLPTYGTDKAPFSKPYPCLTAACGSFDLNGTPETQAYYSAIIWGEYQKPYIAVRPLEHSGEAFTLGNWRQSDAVASWTWPGYEGSDAQIEVYSQGSEVELFKDGHLIARKPLIDYRCDFTVPYSAGSLEAVSFDEEGKEIARCELQSAGQVSRIVICPEEEKIHADVDNISYVWIELQDCEGILNMYEDKAVHVSVEGEGELLAVGSANPVTEEDFFSGRYTSWHGRALAIARSTGKAGIIKISAKTEGLEEVSATIIAV